MIRTESVIGRVWLGALLLLLGPASTSDSAEAVDVEQGAAAAIDMLSKTAEAQVSRFLPTPRADTVTSQDARRLPAGVSRCWPTAGDRRSSPRRVLHGGVTYRRGKFPQIPRTTAIGSRCCISKCLRRHSFP